MKIAFIRITEEPSFKFVSSFPLHRAPTAAAVPLQGRRRTPTGPPTGATTTLTRPTSRTRTRPRSRRSRSGPESSTSLTWEGRYARGRWGAGTPATARQSLTGEMGGKESCRTNSWRQKLGGKENVQHFVRIFLFDYLYIYIYKAERLFVCLSVCSLCTPKPFGQSQ